MLDRIGHKLQASRLAYSPIVDLDVRNAIYIAYRPALLLVKGFPLTSSTQTVHPASTAEMRTRRAPWYHIQQQCSHGIDRRSCCATTSGYDSSSTVAPTTNFPRRAFSRESPKSQPLFVRGNTYQIASWSIVPSLRDVSVNKGKMQAVERLKWKRATSGRREKLTLSAIRRFFRDTG